MTKNSTHVRALWVMSIGGSGDCKRREANTERTSELAGMSVHATDKEGRSRFFRSASEARVDVVSTNTARGTDTTSSAAHPGISTSVCE